MAVTIQGSVSGYNMPWYPVRDNPPIIGDLLIMEIPATEPLHEPGWTRKDGYAWRYAEGNETGFPSPTFWVTGCALV